ncbi:pyrroline-5-carboxylate reductase [Maridesulfovibrio hydrothermalis]|uniref:Pyrroline-5-carboxylate reductase n=1 Tax=Maridesulfovibrio hydrothermalis AM13 = DSM 14728 TaxID=1121451 RepID=L0RDJ9_9BACT|nr:pyrroline-5-carboxylate reductase [Maridesulfovibrio hydrothermalis]CCO24297.1 Pyrroline-5-carboxylate reductase [Maridesulfovibrio hydrothermalis AM13 = DSM 14728]
MTKKVGFIGTGNMGAAIIRGMAGDENITLLGSDLNKTALKALAEETGLIQCDSPRDLAKDSDFIVLAVKPQHAPAVLEEIAPELDESKCVISIAAGLTVSKLKDSCENRCPVVRVMPNTPALVNAGVFAVCLDDAHLSDEQSSFSREMFGPLGDVYVLAENQFDTFTGVIGSGPAYVFYFIEAMIESAVELGLPRDQATLMVEKLFEGSTKLAKESNLHISQLREMVTSPGGTTVQALVHLDRTATRANIIDAVRKSFEKSIELGKK